MFNWIEQILDKGWTLHFTPLRDREGYWGSLLVIDEDDGYSRHDSIRNLLGVNTSWHGLVRAAILTFTLGMRRGYVPMGHVAFAFKQCNPDLLQAIVAQSPLRAEDGMKSHNSSVLSWCPS